MEKERNHKKHKSLGKKALACFLALLLSLSMLVPTGGSVVRAEGLDAPSKAAAAVEDLGEGGGSVYVLPDNGTKIAEMGYDFPGVIIKNSVEIKSCNASGEPDNGG